MKNDDTNLQEMSLSRKEIERKLSLWSDVIYTHLLKLYYFRNDKHDFYGWCISVYKCAFHVDTLKSPNGKAKRPDAQTIYNWMWGCHEDSFYDWHKGTLKDFNNKGDPEYKNLPYIHGGGDVIGSGAFIKAYHIWLSEELSKKGSVTTTDVQNKIKELYKDYPFEL